MLRNLPSRDQLNTSLDRRGVLRRLAASLAVGTGSLGGPALAAAQPATPAGPPVADDALAQARGTVQFIHPEKVYFYLPGFQDEAFVARGYGLDLDAYQAIRAEFAAAARWAAEALVADPDVAARLDRLFAPGALVVAIGESDTDDLQSWFEILRHALDLRRPRDSIRLLNLAVSGQPTTTAFNQLFRALGESPDWILCGLGGNDAVRIGLEPTKTVVSIAETELNLREMRHHAATQSAAEWVWLSRWSIDEELIAAYPAFQLGQFSLRGEDFDAVSELVLRQPEPVVDLTSTFGRPPDRAYLQTDGLHPSLAGQQLIAKTVVDRLTA